jgi:hypothetical protein
MATETERLISTALAQISRTKHINLKSQAMIERCRVRVETSAARQRKSSKLNSHYGINAGTEHGLALCKDRIDKQP